MRIRTYLVRADLEKSPWGMAILEAEEIGWFTSKDKFAAHSWATCPCGLLDDALPRDEIGRPKNVKLRDCGRRFSISVRMNDFQAASRDYLEIHERAKPIIAGAKGAAARRRA